jgi:hypothetical protein
MIETVTTQENRPREHSVLGLHASLIPIIEGRVPDTASALKPRDPLISLALAATPAKRNWGNMSQQLSTISDRKRLTISSIG